MNYAKDPDGLKKFRLRRVNFKLLLFGGLFFYWLVQWKCRQVEKFDRLKRKEQRAMQNQEAADVYNKKARFVLFTHEGKQFNESTLAEQQGVQGSSTISGSKYYVFWYDSKMKNYELFIDYLLARRMVQADIQPVLVVDKKA